MTEQNNAATTTQPHAAKAPNEEVADLNLKILICVAVSGVLTITTAFLVMTATTISPEARQSVAVYILWATIVISVTGYAIANFFMARFMRKRRSLRGQQMSSEHQNPPTP